MQPIINLKMQQVLCDYFIAGVKPANEKRIGMEYERVLLLNSGLQPVPYDGGVCSITSLLEEMADRFDWQPFYEGDRILGLKRHEATITLEPAGQFEFSSSPFYTVREIAKEFAQLESELAQLRQRHRFLMLTSGINPLHRVGEGIDEVEWIPKKRYEIMRRVLPTRGKLGLQMMALTSSVQASIDYQSEEDCAEKYRLACALVPLFTALFANSPIAAQKKTGYISYRSEIWTQTDSSRCGIPPFVFNQHEIDSSTQRKGFFADYMRYALAAPMLFKQAETSDNERNPGQPAKLEEFPTARGKVLPTFADFLQQSVGQPKFSSTELSASWQLHLSTLFPEVRLKNFLELRTPDGNRPELALAFVAMCRGIFYHPEARREIWKMLEKFTWAQRLEAQRAAAALGLSAAKQGKYRLLELSRELFGIADAALGELDSADRPLLGPLSEVIFEMRRSPGELLLSMWETTEKIESNSEKRRQRLIEFLSNTNPS
jgi:glutamate--cysteine ligase